jgi:hypothetical protein
MFRDWYIALLPAMFVGTVSWVGYYLSEALNYPLALQTLMHHDMGPNFAFITGAIVGLLFAVACRVDLLLRSEQE